VLLRLLLRILLSIHSAILRDKKIHKYRNPNVSLTIINNFLFCCYIKATCIDEEDRAQVLNLPDKVEPKKQGVKVTVNDLRNVVQKGFGEDKSNRQNISSNLPI